MKTSFTYFAIAISLLLCSGCASDDADFDDEQNEVLPDEAAEAVDTTYPQGFTPNQVTLKEFGEFKELMDDKLVYVDRAGRHWTAPKGTLTDGASIPQVVLSLTGGPFDPQFLKAAIIHDAYCQTDNMHRCPDQYRTEPWQRVHRMFFYACIDNGAPLRLARLMYAAVRMFGPKWGPLQKSAFANATEAQIESQFERCIEWIEANEPTADQIDAWIDREESSFLDRHSS